MKRIISIFLVMIIVTGIMTSCGSPAPNSSSLPASQSSESKASSQSVALPAGDKAIEMTFIRQGTEPEHTEYWLSMLEKFEQAHPGIKVQYDCAAAGEPINTKLSTLFAAGTPPDVSSSGVSILANRVPMGLFEKLDPYLDKDNMRDQVLPKVTEMGSYHGEVYAMAYRFATFVLAYRKDLFEQAGIAIPTNWEEMKSAAVALTIKEGDKVVQGGFDVPTLGNVTMPLYDIFLKQNSGTISDDNDMPTLDTPQALEALEFICDLAAQTSLPTRGDDVLPFLKGNSAMAYMQISALNPMLNDPEYADKVGIIPPVKNTSYGTHGGAAVFSIASDSKYKDESWELMKLIFTDEEVWQRYELLGECVTNQSLLDKYAADMPLNGVFMEWLAVGTPLPKTPWTEKYDNLRNNFIPEVLYNNADPKEILLSAQADLVEESKKY